MTDWWDFKRLVDELRGKNAELVKDHNSEIMLAIAVLDRVDTSRYHFMPHSIDLRTGVVHAARVEAYYATVNIREVFEKNIAWQEREKKEGRRAVLFQNPAAHESDSEAWEE